MKIKTYIVDAFTNQPFKGNPAGVCLLENEIDVVMMQSIATELNHSETAFLLPSLSSPATFSIRYFTPTVEVPFCGHATLASSKVVLSRLGLSGVEFNTHSGLNLSASSEGNHISMNFPLYDTVDYNPGLEMLDAFGIKDPLSTKYCAEVKMLLIEVKDQATLSAIEPDYQKALGASKMFNNVIVTTRSSNKGFDFYSRCFCPWIGINEDPVTGASHTVLAKYWGDKLNKTEMNAYQLSRRGGFLNLKITGPKSLQVRSEAQIVLEGLFEIL